MTPRLGSDSQGGARLPINDAVILGHALVQQIAGIASVRTLLIKGPMLERYGLRESHISSDVDVLVDPAAFSRFRTAVGAVGWQERPQLSRAGTHHAVSLYHAEWPCDIDLHREFPGLLRDSASVFEEIWRSRRSYEFAGQRCDVPSRAASVVIHGLHLLRDDTHRQTRLRDLEYLSSVEFSDTERRELSQLAEDTGCTWSLGPVLHALGVPLPQRSPDPEVVQASVLWSSRQALTPEAFTLARLLTEGTLRARMSNLTRAAWPRAEDLMSANPRMPKSRRARTRARLAHWRRAVGAASALLREWVRRID